MTLTITEEMRAKAEVYHGDAAGQEKTRLLLQETGLPNGLLPLKDIIECGYVEETGFVWLRQRKKVDHYFAKAGRHVSYAAEVSAYADQGRLKKITGVKAKEMLIWVTLHEICVDDPPTGKLTCKAIGGLSRSFPVEAFIVDAPPVPPRIRSCLRPAAATAVDATKDAVTAAGNEQKQVSNGAAAATVAVAEEPAKKEGNDEQEEKEEDGDKEAAAATTAVDEIDGKMKELNKEVVVQAEAVAAKN